LKEILDFRRNSSTCYSLSNIYSDSRFQVNIRSSQFLFATLEATAQNGFYFRIVLPFFFSFFFRLLYCVITLAQH